MILPYYDDVIISLQKQAFISLIRDIPMYKRTRLINFINSMDPSELILLDNNVVELISRYTDNSSYSEDSEDDDVQEHQHVEQDIETEDVDEETDHVDEETDHVDEETEDVDEETEDVDEETDHTDICDVKNLSEYSDEYEYTQDYTKKNN